MWHNQSVQVWGRSTGDIKSQMKGPSRCYGLHTHFLLSSFYSHLIFFSVAIVWFWEMFSYVCTYTICPGSVISVLGTQMITESDVHPRGLTSYLLQEQKASQKSTDQTTLTNWLTCSPEQHTLSLASLSLAFNEPTPTPSTNMETDCLSPIFAAGLG